MSDTKLYSQSSEKSIQNVEMKFYFPWNEIVFEACDAWIHIPAISNVKIHKRSFIFGAATIIGFSWAFKILKKIVTVNEYSENCLLFSPYQVTWGMCSIETNSTCNLLACPTCTFKRFFKLLKKTVRQIDICVYLITSEKVTNLLIKLFNKGIRVRIITDQQMSLQGKSVRIKTFCKNNIPIKVIDTEDIMHNKFVIIDQKILITGSFNWTQQGFSRNFENAIVTHDKKVIQNYSAYFEHLWLSGTGQNY